MRIEIEIPKEFEKHFNEDKFKDSFERIMADIKHSLENGDCLCAGRYEHETIEMLENAFENSRKAYDLDNVVDKLEHTCDFTQSYKSMDEFGNYVDKDIKMIRIDNAIKIVKEGVKHEN